MQPPKPPVPHDPALCFCGDVTGCVCPCEDCRKRREGEQRALRLQSLQERLEKGGIDMEDFAALIWLLLDTAIEQRVERITRDTLRTLLKDLTLTSQVRGSSIDWK